MSFKILKPSSVEKWVEDALYWINLNIESPAPYEATDSLDNEMKMIGGINLSLLPRQLQEKITVTLQDAIPLKKRQSMDELNPSLGMVRKYKNDITTTIADLIDKQALSFTRGIFYGFSLEGFFNDTLLNIANINEHDFYVTWKNGTPEILRYFLGKLGAWISSLPNESNKKPIHIRTPLALEEVWAFKGYVYKFEYKNQPPYSLEEEELLILENYDQERQKFEKLKRRYKSEIVERESYQRERIPEEVRIAVWRRDGGKCVRCGSREKLEYDHIVPVSKGGSNTARNIELLCESCNRKKSNNIE